MKILNSLFTLLILIPSKVFAQETAQAPLNAIKNLEEVAQAQVETAKKLIDMIIEFCVKYSFQVIGGLIVLFLGWLIANYIAKIISKLLIKNKVDVTVAKFIVGGIKLIIFTFAAIVALGKFGIEIAPLIAGLSVAGFGLTFALQGPLSNYASGVTLIFTKPFKVGEIIEVAGVIGEVTDLKLPRTEIKTIDGNMIVIPNRHIIGEIIHNYSTSKCIKFNIGVAYSADVDKAIELIEKIIAEDKRIVKTPNIGISEFADSCVNIYARAWCKQDEYWNVLFSVNRKIFAAFNDNNIEIPFPQRDVHIIKES